LMARGATPQDALRKLGTVEGLTTAPILRELSHSLGIELPITNGIVDALEGRPIGDVIADFMGRPPTGE
jgi:glycerol-3-phosphate dehydrogenase (NAD(P)+)